MKFRHVIPPLRRPEQPSIAHAVLRRTAVRNLVRAGVPQTVAMKLTGHKTDSVFRRYDIVSPNDLRVAVERLDAVATQAK